VPTKNRVGRTNRCNVCHNRRPRDGQLGVGVARMVIETRRRPQAEAFSTGFFGRNAITVVMLWLYHDRASRHELKRRHR
jgi:hypothetical protein